MCCCGRGRLLPGGNPVRGAELEGMDRVPSTARCPPGEVVSGGPSSSSIASFASVPSLAVCTVVAATSEAPRLLILRVAQPGTMPPPVPPPVPMLRMVPAKGAPAADAAGSGNGADGALGTTAAAAECSEPWAVTVEARGGGNTPRPEGGRL